MESLPLALLVLAHPLIVQVRVRVRLRVRVRVRVRVEVRVRSSAAYPPGALRAIPRARPG